MIYSEIHILLVILCIIRLPWVPKWIYIVNKLCPTKYLIYNIWIRNFVHKLRHPVCGGLPWGYLKYDISWQGGGLRRPKRGWRNLWTDPTNSLMTDHFVWRLWKNHAVGTGNEILSDDMEFCVGCTQPSNSPLMHYAHMARKCAY